MDKIMRFAVIGCGHVAPLHAKSIEEIPNAQLVAVADIDDERSQVFARKYEVKAYTDYHKMLVNEKIDVVNICTPTGLHAQMALDSLQLGKHVIIEKPIALTLEDVDKVSAMANSFHRKVAVVLQNRFNPPIQELRQVIDKGLLGKLLLGNATLRWYRPQSYYDDGWHGTLNMDGGALLNQALHEIDILLWLMGDVEGVFAYTATLAHKMEMEDTGVAVVKFKSGALGVIEGSTISYPKNLEGSISVIGETGSVQVGGTNLDEKIIWQIGNDGLNHQLPLHNKPDILEHHNSHMAIIHDMIQAIKNDTEPMITIREARKSIDLVLSIYKAARMGIQVRLNTNY